MQRLSAPPEILDELGQAVLVVEDLLLGLLFPLVRDGERESLVEEGQLAQAVGQRSVVEPALGKNLSIREEGDLGARRLGLSRPLELLDRLTPLERHVMVLAVARGPDVP